MSSNPSLHGAGFLLGIRGRLSGGINVDIVFIKVAVWGGSISAICPWNQLQLITVRSN